jgi:hypothetical protein
LAEFEPVKAVTAAEKMRLSVALIFEEHVKAPSIKKQQTEAKPSDKLTPRPRPKGKSIQDKGTQSQATACTPEKKHTKYTVSPTLGRKRQRSSDAEEELSPCHKQVIMAEADFSDAVSVFD